ncbi:MAG: apolipoprotein N-acyltransferase [Neisseriaceae bacterium]|nr:apolipoprotein N-acyltransferase [Neisseriaceae bacterium]
MNHSGSLKRFYWLIALISGAVSTLSFAPFYWFWLMPLSLALLLLIAVKMPQKAVKAAFLWGFAAALTQNYWVNISLHSVAGLTQWLALPMTLLLPAALAVYPAAVFWLAKKFRLPEKIKWGVVLPLLWTISEYLRTLLLSGFAWGLTGYSQIAEFSPLSGFAPVGGILLVSLATFFISAWLALFYITKSKRYIILIAAILFSGSLLTHISWTEPDGTKNTVALVQGNVEQSMKFDPQQMWVDMEQYYLDVAKIDNADIVILPESAIPLLRQLLPPETLQRFADTARDNKAALATGIVQETPDGLGYENAVINLSQYDFRQPENIPYYAKNHLVPFGEFRPLPALTAGLYNMMNMPLSDFSRGGKNQQPLLLAQQKVAFNICYEDSFGDELVQSAKQASLMANVSNMGWFGRSNAMEQQLQHSQARSLENGRYMVRATNNGITAIINPHGQVVAFLPRDTHDILIGEIEGYTGQTPYMKMGGSLPLIIALALILCGLLLVNRYSHKNKA